MPSSSRREAPSNNNKGKSHRSEDKSRQDRRRKIDGESSSKKSHRDRRPWQSVSLNEAPLSFLFVIVEFYVLDSPGHTVSNHLGHLEPPRSPISYHVEGEFAGYVWRYMGGVVDQAGAEYCWDRPNATRDGRIVAFTYRQGNDGPDTEICAQRAYKTYSLFNCGQASPCIWTDTDSSVHEVPSPSHRWHPLSFQYADVHEDEHDRSPIREPLTTRIGHGQSLVVGADPSWIPRVVPENYANANARHPSQGLGGILGVILGLMALARNQGEADAVFRERQWHNHLWRDNRHARHAPDPSGPPRGILVHICFDGENREGSTLAALQSFEEHGVAIRG